MLHCRVDPSPRCCILPSSHHTATLRMSVMQVLKPQLRAVKSTVRALKAGLAALKGSSGSSGSGATSKPAKVKQPKPAYLELMVNLQQIVFSLEQHPLETWLGLHAPLLQSVAAERHLTEQLLASCASAHGRISRTVGAGAAGKDGVVAGRGGGRQAQRFASGKKQAKQWQSRRWGTLGKKGANAVLAGIAAGSITEAAGAAAAGAVAGTGPVLTGYAAGSGIAAAHHTSAAAAAAGAAQHAASDTAGPSTPVAADVVARSSSDAEASAGAAAGDASDGEGRPGEVSADESSEDTDSSDVEGPIQLADPDALAAALPSSAQELAAAAARQGGASAGLTQAASQQAGASTAAAAAGADAGGVPADAAAAAAVLSAAAAGVDAGNGNTEMAQAILEAHRELFAMYKYRCRPLDALAEDRYHHSRAVMHVSCVKAEAVVLVCLPGNAAADAMATEVGVLGCASCCVGLATAVDVLAQQQ